MLNFTEEKPYKHTPSDTERWIINFLIKHNLDKETKLYLIHHNRAKEFNKEEKDYDYIFKQKWKLIPKGLTKTKYKEILKGVQKNIDYYKERFGNNNEDWIAEAFLEDWIEKKRKLKAIINYNGDKKDDIQKAKEYPIELLLEFDKAGFAKCPFHEDKTPSLKLYKNNTAYCFGGCGKKDSIDVCMIINNISLPEAVKKLCNN